MRRNFPILFIYLKSIKDFMLCQTWFFKEEVSLLSCVILYAKRSVTLKSVQKRKLELYVNTTLLFHKGLQTYSQPTEFLSLCFVSMTTQNKSCCGTDISQTEWERRMDTFHAATLVRAATEILSHFYHSFFSFGHTVPSWYDWKFAKMSGPILILFYS